jgi:hypothetical protein
VVQQPQPSQPLYDCPPVISSFTASPSYIQFGQTAVLTWTVTDAASVSLSPGIGSVPSSGSYSVTPSYTTTYTLTATNVDGSVSASTTVTVAPNFTTYNTSSGGYVADAGNNTILTLGLTGDDGQVNSRLLYVLLIGLLALAAVGVIVFLVRRPAAASAAGNRTGTRAGYMPWTGTATRVDGDLPQTTPVDIEPGPKFVTSDGGSVPLSGSSGSLGRRDFRSMAKSGKADMISREHIQFDCEDGDYYIEDRNSTNGTKVNGTRISGKGRFLLSDGDVIDLADALSLTFKSQ